MSVPDTNHNIKNSRYQLVGGSSPASIGSHVFDPTLLKKTGVAQQLWRIEDFASHAVVLRLASVHTILKLVALAWKEDIHLDVGIMQSQ